MYALRMWTQNFDEHENEKKRKYQQRVIYMEMGSFIPLVFGRKEEWGRMQTFSEQPSGEIFPK